MNGSKRSPAALVAAAGLFALAAVTAWDASGMRKLPTYGVGPASALWLVAGLLALLGLCHLWAWLRGGFDRAAAADWRAVAWVAAALGALILVIELGGGFILAAALLFTFTARSLGRRALLVDLLIGALLGLVVFLVFNNLLTLSLPSGPIERLL